MTEQFIETLKSIKKYCKENALCGDCKLSYLCIFSVLGEKLGKLPYEWDIEEIERILKQYD